MKGLPDAIEKNTFRNQNVCVYVDNHILLTPVRGTPHQKPDDLKQQIKECVGDVLQAITTRTLARVSDRHEKSNTHVVQGSRQEVYNLEALPLAQDQCILQIVSTLIFNEAEWDYQPVTILLDSGAQRSFNKSGLCEELKLPVLRTTSFTTSGMGEQQEQFNSSEVQKVQITLKSLYSSEKLKNLSVHTKQKLTTDMQTASLKEADLRFISNKS
ncbi:unnamed protein product [Cylicocyclus nassatus]|uniref:Peptidase aspartic putative domain-containing protein n=1 Tax=Cylicocyclus nassatus TaxID=53992 RepID=A0AA36MGQ3_CYLNA|nr:unnamed protein product [Cylicocyclus nassatus]